jgi:MbtH protein
MFEDDDGRTYVVVVNHEEQYSIWPDGREIPAGWRSVGVTGEKPVCLAYIEKVWTDMRPLSLRKEMARWASEAGDGGNGELSVVSADRQPVGHDIP